MINSRHQKRILTLVFFIVLLLCNISIVIDRHESDVHFVVQSGGDKLDASFARLSLRHRFSFVSIEDFLECRVALDRNDEALDEFFDVDVGA